MLRFRIFLQILSGPLFSFCFLRHIGFKLKKRLITLGVAAVSVYGLYFTAYGLRFTVYGLGLWTLRFCRKMIFGVLVV